MSIHVAIIGAYGSAGAAAAGKLVDESEVELTLIDDGDPGGGLCILRGCMPSKEVLSAGAHRYQARHDDRLEGNLPDVNLDRVVERKDDHTLGWAGHRRDSVQEYAEQENVTFIRDTATFVDDHVIEAGGETIEPDYVVVATGSSVNVPDVPGIEDIDYMTSADVLDATSFPDSGIVMGLGYIGLEMVPYLAEAGEMDITAVEHDNQPIDEAPPAFGQAILDIYREDFDVEIPTNVHEQRLEPTEDGGVRLVLTDDDGSEMVREADQLFCFTGRRPSLDRLGLENTRLEPEGWWVEETMQATDDERVFVVGDVNMKEPILHVAKEQAFQAAENILAHANSRELGTYDNVHHHVIFSGLGVYPFARVGHTEESAQAEGHRVITVTRQAADDGVFKTKDVPAGLATLVVDRNDGTVLGYQGLHYHADVMAKTLQVIVELGLDVRDVPDRAYHPTTPEILDGLFREAAEAVEDD
ncbi:dihydrolipoyl dehydrogenase family protein [Halovenus rubra]|uniref:Dihydrolipoyl dehydrogenase family protein n=2 Tax=Halovenus rubra TaxID=869890 RepID=A0ACC7E1X7_9EURY|nr:NAD(P)/FAD-dependent oxidoreductase [Halovenus rubra]